MNKLFETFQRGNAFLCRFGECSLEPLTALIATDYSKLKEAIVEYWLGDLESPELDDVLTQIAGFNFSVENNFQLQFDLEGGVVIFEEVRVG